MYKKLCGLAVATALIVVGPAAAQVPDIHVEPYVGIFVPLNEVADQDVLGFDFLIDQQAALALGARATTFLRDRWGVQANFMYAFSDAEVKFATVGPREETAYAWALDGRIVYALRPGPTSVFLSGGVGVISHGDDAYRSVTEGETDFMGVGGAAIHFDLRERVAFRFDLDGFFYYARPTVDSRDFGEALQLDSTLQTDLVLSGGLQIAFSP